LLLNEQRSFLPTFIDNRSVLANFVQEYRWGLFFSDIGYIYGTYLKLFVNDALSAILLRLLNPLKFVSKVSVGGNGDVTEQQRFQQHVMQEHVLRLKVNIFRQRYTSERSKYMYMYEI